MDKYECTVCGYIYDPEKGDAENGIEPGLQWENVFDNWICPLCAATKDEFIKIE